MHNKQKRTVQSFPVTSLFTSDQAEELAGTGSLTETADLADFTASVYGQLQEASDSTDFDPDADPVPPDYQDLVRQETLDTEAKAAEDDLSKLQQKALNSLETILDTTAVTELDVKSNNSKVSAAKVVLSEYRERKLLDSKLAETGDDSKTQEQLNQVMIVNGVVGDDFKNALLGLMALSPGQTAMKPVRPVKDTKS